jgi:hypothetical protein
MPVLLLTNRNYAAMGHFADYMFELNGGVIDVKLCVQPLFYVAQNALTH